MPAFRQASISNVPAGAVRIFPSTVKVTSAIRLQRPLNYGQFHMFCERARLAVQVILELLAEFLHKGNRRHCRGITQRAEGTAQHVFRQVLDVVDILGLAKSGVETGQRLLQPVSTFAAGNTPAAAFVLVKTNSPQREFDHAGLIVDDYRSEERRVGKKRRSSLS